RPSLRAEFWKRDPKEVLIKDVLGASPETHHLQRAKLPYASYWQERPSDTLPVYRELFQAGLAPGMRGRILTRARWEPWLVAWSAENRPKLPSLWRTFLEDLAASTNFFVKLDAQLLRLQAAETDEELRSAATNVFDMLLANRDAIK